MTNIEALIKFVDRLIDNATETDTDGIEYFKDLNIPACELNDLHERVIKAKEELRSKKEDRVWSIYKLCMEANFDSRESLDKAIKTVNYFTTNYTEK